MRFYSTCTMSVPRIGARYMWVGREGDCAYAPCCYQHTNIDPLQVIHVVCVCVYVHVTSELMFSG
jgi:hypothetical protein